MFSQKPKLLRFCVALLLLLSTALLPAQEDCSNGIDDDGDGLTDLNDTDDCSCAVPPVTTSLLPNPSLESFSADQPGCTSRQPGGLPDNTNQANCLEGWQRVSLGTTDAWNAFTLPGAPPAFPAALPQPLPSGTGVAGFWVGIKDVDGVQFRNGNGKPARHYREYLAACLEGGQSLHQGRDYRLTFSLGFMQPQQLELTYVTSPVHLASPGPVELSIYGVKDCAQLNFGDYYDCPEAAGAEGYELLANVTVAGEPGKWTPTTIDFISPGTYAGFAIGGSCADDLGRPGGGPYRNYYFIDDLILNEIEAFAQPVAGPVAVSGQTICADTITLTGRPRPGARYQWYRDGVAIGAATDYRLALLPTPTIDGAYTLRITTAEGCAITEPVNIQRPVIFDRFADSVALCRPGEEVTVYPSLIDGATYTWSDGSTGTAYTIREPGRYSVTVSTACVQRVEEFVATYESNFSYRYRISPERPCRGDTVTLSLETDWYVSLSAYFVPGRLPQYVGRGEAIAVVAGEVSSIQALMLGPCGLRSDRIDIPVFEPLAFTATVTDLHCTAPTGNIDVDVNGAAGVSYHWRDPLDRPLLGGSQLIVPQTGTYTLKIDSPDHCETTHTYPVTSYDDFSLTVNTTDTRCGNDATAVALASGGAPPYRVDWFAGADAAPVDRNRNLIDHLDRGLYTAEVTDAAGCRTSTAFTVTGPEPLRATATAGFAQCDSDTAGTITLSASGGNQPYRYGPVGRPQQDSPTLTGLAAGPYRIAVTDALGCRTVTPPVTIELPPAFTVEAGADRRIYVGEEATLQLVLQDIDPATASIEWTYASHDGDNWISSDDQQLVASPDFTTRYTATVTDPWGCVRSDSVTVIVDRGVRTYAPTAFSPNGDGYNDHFTLYGNPLVKEISQLSIYDRWGGLIWEKSTDQPAEWDGYSGSKPSQAGTYVYRAELKLTGGETRVHTGSFLLMR